MAYSQDTYTMPMPDNGKHLTVYAKQADGSRKAVADTFNSDSVM
jgi:hypothetical protein